MSKCSSWGHSTTPVFITIVGDDLAILLVGRNNVGGAQCSSGHISAILWHRSGHLSRLVHLYILYSCSQAPHTLDLDRDDSSFTTKRIVLQAACRRGHALIQTLRAH